MKSKVTVRRTITTDITVEVDFPDGVHTKTVGALGIEKAMADKPGAIFSNHESNYEVVAIEEA